MVPSTPAQHGRTAENNELENDELEDDPALRIRQRGTLIKTLLAFASLALVAAVAAVAIHKSQSARLEERALRDIGMARSAMGIGCVLALGCAVLAVASMRRDASEREHNLRELHRANRRLREANESLDIEIREGERVRRDNERVIADLARSNRELDQFAYVTSHDLKAPLRGIASLAASIEEDAARTLSDESREHLRLMQIRVARMDASIDGLLEYCRAGRAETPLEQVDVEELVYEIVEIATLPDDAQVDVDGSLPVLITHRVPLQLVLTNLVVNAAKHGRGAAGVRIRVSAERESDAWIFTVADQGPGIEPRFHSRIFGLFQTLAPRDRVEGTGIGLAVVAKTIQSRGGWVDVDSDRGAGARFRFSWPDHEGTLQDAPISADRRRDCTPPQAAAS